LPDSSNLQEIDYEYVTDATSTSQPKSNTKSLFYTNHTPTTEDATTSPAPSDVQIALHEYCVDWVPEKTTIYLDGLQQSIITSDVPNTPGLWIWDNWSNGNPRFSAGLTGAGQRVPHPDYLNVLQSQRDSESLLKRKE
jgi:hypothetical protein